MLMVTNQHPFVGQDAIFVSLNQPYLCCLKSSIGVLTSRHTYFLVKSSALSVKNQRMSWLKSQLLITKEALLADDMDVGRNPGT